MIKYPVYQTSLNGNEKKYLNEAFDSSWISSKGVFIERFESMVADFLAVPAATSCGNGTVALHLAMLALGIKAGDEVIVPSFTYIASVNAIAYVGAIPVFVDSLATTLQIDPEKIAEVITPKTKAIMIPHLYGHAANMNRIMEIANKHNLFVIEDAAEAFGSKYDGKMIGSIGHVASFSFFGNKTITTGEGGMLVSNDTDIIKRVAHYKSQGLESLNPDKTQSKEYWHDVIGYNYRMTNLAAAIGVAQMERVNSIIAKKRQIREWYAEELRSIPALSVLGEDSLTTSSYWMVCLLCDSKKQRDTLRVVLREKGVETRPLFPCVHTMPPYAHLASADSFPVGLQLSACGMNLPSYPDLEFTDIQEICRIISDSVAA
ncbi:MAG: DegT/DnrJ/EryC1/StrS family aminotransferase [Rickettsiales bacterium]